MIRVFLSILVFFSSYIQFSAFAENTIVEARVIEISDLQKDASLMTTYKRPMVVEMSAEDCPYCLLVEETVLRPMILSGEYKDKILLRKVNINNHQQVMDFKGKKISQSEFADYYNVHLTPTVLFLDDHGNEIAPRMVGVPSIDFYGIYLDDNINLARKLLTKTN